MQEKQRKSCQLQHIYTLHSSQEESRTEDEDHIDKLQAFNHRFPHHTQLQQNKMMVQTSPHATGNKNQLGMTTRREKKREK